jgi:hypothetical protein
MVHCSPIIAGAGLAKASRSSGHASTVKAMPCLVGGRLPASPWEYLHVAIRRRPLKSRKVTRLFFTAFCWNLAMTASVP